MAYAGADYDVAGAQAATTRTAAVAAAEKDYQNSLTAAQGTQSVSDTTAYQS